MPIYEYECQPCQVVYEVRQGLHDLPLTDCPRCREPVTRLVSAPNLNLANFSSPTAARYAKMSKREELARELELQKEYKRIWLPPPVKHDPME